MVFCGVGSFGFLPSSSSLLPVMFLSFCGLGNWATIVRERERKGNVFFFFCRWMEKDIRREYTYNKVIPAVYNYKSRFLFIYLFIQKTFEVRFKSVGGEGWCPILASWPQHISGWCYRATQQFFKETG